MDGTGAYGGGKAGGSFDPISFVQRPPVLLRGVCWLFSIIVFGCITSQGWQIENNKSYCLYNRNSFACNYGVFIGVVGFLASMALLAGEYLFEQMSSVKTRKHFVMADLGFSAGWAFLFFIAFCYLTNQWNKSEDPPMGYGVSNMRSAIIFSFFSIFAWGGSAWFAYQRFKQGVDAAFAPSYESDPTANAYSSYPVGNTQETDQYNEPPFGTQQPGQTSFQAPTY